MARPAHRQPRHVPTHRHPSKLPSARAVGTGAVAAGCIAMTLVPVAAGAKGRTNGGGHGGGGTPVLVAGGAATCSVPETALGSAIMISGSGYAPGAVLQEWMVGPYTGISFIGADGQGNLGGDLGWANRAGDYTVTVKDSASGATEASCAFSIS
ncbi:MAG TPA: hypothetical protein VFW71_11575 [Actinomycetota bacterium]|nr:hypothetical protein [Actinomycetota bacterium]